MFNSFGPIIDVLGFININDIKTFSNINKFCRILIKMKLKIKYQKKNFKFSKQLCKITLNYCKLYDIKVPIKYKVDYLAMIASPIKLTDRSKELIKDNYEIRGDFPKTFAEFGSEEFEYIQNDLNDIRKQINKKRLEIFKNIIMEDKDDLLSIDGFRIVFREILKADRDITYTALIIRKKDFIMQKKMYEMIIRPCIEENSIMILDMFIELCCKRNFLLEHGIDTIREDITKSNYKYYLYVYKHSGIFTRYFNEIWGMSFKFMKIEEIKKFVQINKCYFSRSDGVLSNYDFHDDFEENIKRLKLIPLDFYKQNTSSEDNLNVMVKLIKTYGNNLEYITKFIKTSVFGHLHLRIIVFDVYLYKSKEHPIFDFCRMTSFDVFKCVLDSKNISETSSKIYIKLLFIIVNNTTINIKKKFMYILNLIKLEEKKECKNKFYKHLIKSKWINCSEDSIKKEIVKFREFLYDVYYDRK